MSYRVHRVLTMLKKYCLLFCGRLIMPVGCKMPHAISPDVRVVTVVNSLNKNPAYTPICV